MPRPNRYSVVPLMQWDFRIHTTITSSTLFRWGAGIRILATGKLIRLLRGRMTGMIAFVLRIRSPSHSGEYRAGSGSEVPFIQLRLSLCLAIWELVDIALIFRQLIEVWEVFTCGSSHGPSLQMLWRLLIRSIAL